MASTGARPAPQLQTARCGALSRVAGPSGTELGLTVSGPAPRAFRALGVWAVALPGARAFVSKLLLDVFPQCFPSLRIP